MAAALEVTPEQDACVMDISYLNTSSGRPGKRRLLLVLAPICVVLAGVAAVAAQAGSFTREVSNVDQVQANLMGARAEEGKIPSEEGKIPSEEAKAEAKRIRDAMRDNLEWYAVLGVSEHLAETAIDKKYKKLALLLHPDKTGTDKYCEEAFKEMQNAYTNREGFRDLSRGENFSSNETPRGLTLVLEESGEHTFVAMLDGGQFLKTTEAAALYLNGERYGLEQKSLSCTVPSEKVQGSWRKGATLWTGENTIIPDKVRFIFQREFRVLQDPKQVLLHGEFLGLENSFQRLDVASGDFVLVTIRDGNVMVGFEDHSPSSTYREVIIVEQKLSNSMELQVLVEVIKENVKGRPTIQGLDFLRDVTKLKDQDKAIGGVEEFLSFHTNSGSLTKEELDKVRKVLEVLKLRKTESETN